ncbi:GntP family permease [Anaerosphaera multitolerans]|uniref:GntP family permease n=1 Tax=Anaerosphaera multitolerans TaxID=2487351 RepID=A0A437S6X3_9FIRM|nr:Na+/H+ antiporter NhaC family protein [Anaerosphaera multitolerans]RVU54790.1 GntP family permease [Anaerosphaera multitolerans]
MNLGNIILVAAILLFALLAFKQISAIILAPVVSIFVIVFSGMPILSSLKEYFMPSAANYVSSYFLVFFVGAIFGAIYQFTGAAESIARFIAKISKGKFVAPIIMTITGILTYGGISGFVVFFVVYPIALQLFKEANITRRLIPAAISSGCWTWSMSGPGSPSIQNVIASENLGTPATAAFLPSLISSIIMYILIFVWLEYRAKKFAKSEIFFVDNTLKYQLTESELSYDENKSLPNEFLALIPIITILVAFNILKLAVETSVTIGIVLSVLLFYKKIGNPGEWVNVFNKGAADSGTAILNTAIVVGFGGIVQETQAFSDLVNSLVNINISPLIFVMITVAICAGACGSASGGLGVAFNALKDIYLSLGINLEYVHRISTIAAGTLDTLPHQGAQITLLNICKLTHKEAYYDIAITQIIIPFIICFVFIGLVNIGIV